MQVSMQLSYAGGFKESAEQVSELEKAGLDLAWVPLTVILDPDCG